MAIVCHIIRPIRVWQVVVYYDVSGVPATGASNAASTLGTTSTLAAFLQRLKQSGGRTFTIYSHLAALLHKWHVSLNPLPGV
jgi:hypothetical protein